jgi:hypothetical protein
VSSQLVDDRSARPATAFDATTGPEYDFKLTKLFSAGPSFQRRRCGCRQPIAAFVALRALLADVTLPVKAGGKDRANGHAGR